MKAYGRNLRWIEDHQYGDEMHTGIAMPASGKSEVGEITETLKENGITEFTISSTFSSLIPTLAEFAKHGFQMAGLTEVKANYTDFQTQERAVIPAIQMAAEEA